MLKSLSILFFLVVLSSCNSDKNVLYATTEGAGNIAVGSSVLMKDYKVGEVVEIKVDDQLRIRLKMRFSAPNKFPVDSKFQIGSKDIFQDAIIITPGTSASLLTKDDEIIIHKREVINDLENMVDWMSDRIEGSEIKEAADSLVKELNKLSETIENLGDFDIKINRDDNK